MDAKPNLIDRDKLIQKLNHFYGVEAGKPLSGNVIAALSAIDEAPVIAAEPPMAIWQRMHKQYRCSNCHHIIDEREDSYLYGIVKNTDKQTYCYWCGAKMDLEVQYGESD